MKPFDYIWDRAVLPAQKLVLSECDRDFRTTCDLRAKAPQEWRDSLYTEYQRLREQLKDVCYGHMGHDPEYRLDGRKVASVLCGAMVRVKGCRFDTQKAKNHMAKKQRELAGDPVAFNRWAAANIYINYKLAFYAALQLVFLTMNYDQLSIIKSPETSPQERNRATVLIRAMNEAGHLSPYPRPLVGDAFDVNIIIGLARTDMSGAVLDMFLFAMLLYQVEEHTKDQLSLPKEDGQ